MKQKHGDKLKSKHNPKPWSDKNYGEEAGEAKHNLPKDEPLTHKSKEEITDFIKNNSEDRQLTDNEVKYMSNTEAGQALKIMKDDDGGEDEFGSTDREEKVKTSPALSPRNGKE